MGAYLFIKEVVEFKKNLDLHVFFSYNIFVASAHRDQLVWKHLSAVTCITALRNKETGLQLVKKLPMSPFFMRIFCPYDKNGRTAGYVYLRK